MNIDYITAIILNFNSSNDTIKLYEQLTGFYENLKIIVIDNNSNVNDINLLANNIGKENIIFNNKNLGYAGGNNIGIRKAVKEGAKYIWILNPDVRVEKETLPTLLKEYQGDNKLAAVGSRVCYRNNKNRIFSDGGVVNKDTYLAHHINYNKYINDDNIEENKSISYINGDSILMNVNAIKRIGCFYEGFFLYYEETEWCARAIKNDWRIRITTDAVVYHSTSNKGKLYAYYMMRNRLIYARIYSKKFSSFRNQIALYLILEFISGLKRFKLPQNFYFSRLKGFVSGTFHNLNKYNESISNT